MSTSTPDRLSGATSPATGPVAGTAGGKPAKAPVDPNAVTISGLVLDPSYGPNTIAGGPPALAPS